MITWRGFFYLVFTGLNIIVLLYTGRDIFLHFLTVLLLLPVFSMIQLALIIKSFTYQQKLKAETITRQQKTILVINFSQKGMFSSGLINITIKEPPVAKKTIYTNHNAVVQNNVEKSLHIEIGSVHRGLYQVGITRILARDIFGLFWLPVRSRHKCRIELLILTSTPKEAKINHREKLISMLDRMQERKSSDYSSEINDIANLRGQLPGDSLKRVHWKISARLDETIIKEFEKPRQQEILVLWDMRKIPLYGIKEADFLDMYADTAMAIARDVLESGNYTRFVSYRGQSRKQLEADSPGGLGLVKLELAGIEWTSELPAASIIKEETGFSSDTGMLFYLTTNISPDLLDTLRQIKHKGIEVMLVFLPSRQPDMLVQRKLRQMEDEGISAWMPGLPPVRENGQNK